MLAILYKELRSYFNSATAYIFMGIFLLLAGLFFTLTNILPQPNAYFNSVLSSLTFVFILISPMLTMRIVAEETKTRTDQLLFTSPQSITMIILGKYLAAIALFLLTLLITAIYPLILSIFGDIGALEILTAYIGFFLMGSCFLALGVLISSLTENVVVAAVGTLGASLFIWLIDSIQGSLPTSRNSGIIFGILIVLLICAVIYYTTKNLFISGTVGILGLTTIAVIFIVKKELFEGFISKFFGWFSLLDRNSTFTMGILSLSDIIYYLSFSFLCIFLTIRIIDKRRWS